MLRACSLGLLSAVFVASSIASGQDIRPVVGQVAVAGELLERSNALPQMSPAPLIGGTASPVDSATSATPPANVDETVGPPTPAGAILPTIPTIPSPNVPPGLTHTPPRDLTPINNFMDLLPPKPDGNALGDSFANSRKTEVFQNGWYASAEFLLFHVRSDNLDYVIPNGAGGLTTTGPIQAVSFDEAPGLRVALGYRFGEGWDVGFGYTFLHTQGNNSVAAAPGETLFPTMTRPGLTDSVLTASASAVLDYNLYDITFGRQFIVDPHFALRAFGGFRFADIQQKLDAAYNGGDAVQAGVGTNSTFRGFGPIIGGEVVGGGWHGFHVYAMTSGGLIAGRSTNTLLETNDAGGTVFANVPYNIEKVVPVATIGFGGGWQYKCFTIRAGYEVTQWFGLTERARFTDDVAQGSFISRSGNLSLEGFFIQFGMSF